MFDFAFGLGWLGAAVKVVVVVALAAGVGVQTLRLKLTQADVDVAKAQLAKKTVEHEQCIANNREFVATIKSQDAKIENLEVAHSNVSASVVAVNKALDAAAAAGEEWQKEAARVQARQKQVSKSEAATEVLARREAAKWSAWQRKEFDDLSAEAATCRNMQLLLDEHKAGMEQDP